MATKIGYSKGKIFKLKLEEATLNVTELSEGINMQTKD